MMGTTTEWDTVYIADHLYLAAERHEEWMQANLTHGYTSKEYMGEPLPRFVINKRPICLPDGSDILTDEENETIQFATYLHILPCVECSTTDSPRVTGVLHDFPARGKLNIVCADSYFMTLVQGNNMTNDARKLFYC
jgi:hypothetical protein